MTSPKLIQSNKNPFHGIRSFDIEESHLFFGRDKSIVELTSILLQKRFVAITGSSGSGKSSLIKAGLIPAMVKTSEDWQYSVFSPGNNPMGNLSTAIFDFLKSQNLLLPELQTEEQIEFFLSKKSLIDLLRQTGFSKKILIYIDQFEEIFRYRQSESQSVAVKNAQIFVQRILEAFHQKEIEFCIMLSLRSDFLSDCTEFTGLAEVINQGHYLIPQMTKADKEQAIRRPAEVYQVSVDTDLVELLLNECEEFHLGLPLLQHALMRMWQERIALNDLESPLNLRHYEAVGNIQNALSQHTEKIYHNLYSEKRRQTAKKIFKSLTSQSSLRPTVLSDIFQIVDSGKDEIIAVIDEFRAEGNNYLLPSAKVQLSDETVIDIAHESIMQVWNRLQVWVEEESKAAQMYLHLSKTAEMYQEGKAGLLVNPDLQMALKWISDNQPNEAWALRYDPAFDRTMTYIEHSKKEFDKAVNFKESKRERDLKRARNFALFLGFAAIISILFVFASLQLKFKAQTSEKDAKRNEKIAMEEGKIAEEKQKEAVSHKRIAEQQQQIADQQKRLAEEQKLYAIQQQKEALFQKGLALLARNDAVKARDEAKKLQKQAEELRDQAVKQKQIAETERSRAELSEAKTDTLRRLAIAKSIAIQAIKIHTENIKNEQLSKEQRDLPYFLAIQAFWFNKIYQGNPDDPDIFTALSDLAELKYTIKGTNGHSDAVRSICLSTDGKFLISSGDDGSVRLYSTSTLTEKPVLLKTGNFGQKGFRCVTVDVNGKYIAAGAFDGVILIWNTTDLTEKPIVLTGHTGVVYKLFFDKTSKRIFSVGSDGLVLVHDISAPTHFTKIALYSEKINAIALNTSETSLIFAGDKGILYFFDTQNYQKQKEIKCNSGKIMTLLWAKSNEIIIGTASGKIEIRQASNPIIIEKEVFAHLSGINDILYHEQSNELISCSYDGTVKKWDSENFSREPIIITFSDSWFYCLSYNSDNTQIYCGGTDKTIQMLTIDPTLLNTELRKKVQGQMPEKFWKKYIGEDIEVMVNY